MGSNTKVTHGLAVGEGAVESEGGGGLLDRLVGAGFEDAQAGSEALLGGPLDVGLVRDDDAGGLDGPARIEREHAQVAGGQAGEANLAATVGLGAALVVLGGGSGEDFAAGAQDALARADVIDTGVGGADQDVQVADGVAVGIDNAAGEGGSAFEDDGELIGGLGAGPVDQDVGDDGAQVAVGDDAEVEGGDDRGVVGEPVFGVEAEGACGAALGLGAEGADAFVAFVVEGRGDQVDRGSGDGIAAGVDDFAEEAGGRGFDSCGFGGGSFGLDRFAVGGGFGSSFGLKSGGEGNVGLLGHGRAAEPEGARGLGLVRAPSHPQSNSAQHHRQGQRHFHRDPRNDRPRGSSCRAGGRKAGVSVHTGQGQEEDAPGGPLAIVALHQLRAQQLQPAALAPANRVRGLALFPRDLL
ncbi:MAG: hypothetical protein ACYTFV_16285, partial [Planctomycetota bacterium]